MVDMYIDNSEPSENVGQIHFSLEYDFQNTTLILKILQVSQFPLFQILLIFFIKRATINFYKIRVKNFQQRT